MKKINGWQVSFVSAWLVLLLLLAAVNVQAAPRTQAPAPADLLAQVEAIQAEEPTFSDDFSVWDETWSTTSESSAFMHQGDEEVFSITYFGGEAVALSTNATLNDLALTNYLAEVDVTLVSGPAGDSGYGLIFRYVDEENFYLFAVNGDQFALASVIDGEFEQLLSAEKSTAIVTEPEASNRLGVLVEGTAITLLINGEVVQWVEDSTYTTGGIGLAVGASSGNSAEARFDDVALWEVAATPTPALTVTPAVTATGLDAEALATQLDAIRAVDPLYYDEFRRDDGSWDVVEEDDYAFFYNQRMFQMEVLPDNLYTYSINRATTDLDLTDYLVEVDTQAITLPADGQYSLLFRYVDDDNFYAFTIRHDEYALLIQENGEWDALIEFTTTDALDTTEEAVNRLGVLAAGSSITLFVNDVPLAQVEDATFSGGGIGLVAATYQESDLAVAFDNVELWAVTTVDAPTPTPTATPLAEVILDEAALAEQVAEIREGEPDYYDEFRRASDSWNGLSDDNVTYSYQNRALVMEITTGGWIGWNINQELRTMNPADFLVEVDTAYRAGPTDGEYGLVFRYVDGDNLYLAALQADTYGLWRLDAGDWYTLVDWTASSAIDPTEGAVNRLGVLAEGTQITLLINDTPVAQVEDDGIVAGAIGLATGALGEGGVEVAFDNLELWLLAAGPEPTPTPTLDVAAITEQLETLLGTEPTYADDLDRASADWFVGESGNGIFSFDRAYIIEVAGPATMWGTNTALTELDVNDYFVEVETEVGDAAASIEHGLIFRYIDNANFYYFFISDGQFGLAKNADGQFQTILPLADAAPLKDGANLLGVWVQGDQITLVINETPVAQLRDESFATGTVALAAGTGEAESIAVGFENFAFWALDGVVIPTPEGPTVSEFEHYADETIALEYPVDWTVELQESGRVVVQNEETNEGVAIWPLYSEVEITADSAAAMMASIVEQASAASEWSQPEEAGEGILRMVGRDDEYTAVALFTWVNGEAGAALAFYLTVALHDSYLALEPSFAQIIDSFTVAGVPAAATNLADLDFITWEDPDENAYRLELPADWTIAGGLERASTFDARPWLFAASPDEAISLMFGSDQLPIFIVPNAALAAQGYAEGDSYVVGDTELVLAEYTPGVEFAERFGRDVLGLDACTIDTTQALPELEAAIRDYVEANELDAYGIRQDVGTITYTCEDGNLTRHGTLLAFTVLANQEGVEIWQASTLLAYEATPERLAEAQAIVGYSVASWHPSLDWLAEQPEMTMADAETQQAASVYFAELIAAEIAGGAISGVDTSELEVATSVTDDAGDDYELLGGAGYPWIDAAGNLIGTELPVRPADFVSAELVQAE
ncbi:MAG: hypothetical protein KF832_17365 [Caldilineaceae bacterium]|nr:hypothetical protein [Caldilineaceae bacterium]